MVLTLGILMMAALAQGAAADPINAKNSFAFPATCDDGQTVQVVLNGNGDFTPAHVVGNTAVFIPQVIDTTFQFTPPGGPTQTETFHAAKPNVHGDLVTCSFDVSQTTRGGPSGSSDRPRASSRRRRSHPGKRKPAEGASASGR